ncbi:MAG: hypothetical protein IKF90_18950, partial [Parasporobacterium sp.]|nr:hypothetical protein [Parasporobacterium sp.]
NKSYNNPYSVHFLPPYRTQSIYYPHLMCMPGALTLMFYQNPFFETNAYNNLIISSPHVHLKNSPAALSLIGGFEKKES